MSKKSQVWEGERVLVIPDSQNGFRGHQPMHDRGGWEAAVTMAPHVNRIVMLGDMLDLPALSKYTHGNDLRGATSKAIKETKYWLGRLHQANPDAPKEYIFGNHEERLAAHFKKFCPDLADVFSLEEALGLDALGITAHAPYGRDFKYKGVLYTHGHLHAKEGGLTASKYLNEYECSVVYGHCHKRVIAYKTGKNGKERFAGSPGMLCRNDGIVPGSSAVNNWQKGLMIVTYNDGFDPTPSLLPYINKKLLFNGCIIPIQHDNNARQKELGF